MAETILPYEVKRLIYNYLDFDSFKSLRLVSKSWAAVGVDTLLLPTFVVKSSSFDIPRLLEVARHHNFGARAAKTVTSIDFWSNDWDPAYLKAIFCSRHVQVEDYEIVDFVPTEAEQKALNMLEVAKNSRVLDDLQDEDDLSLLNALKQVPLVTGIHFAYPNPFQTQPMLRKLWDEYCLEAVRPPALEAGLIRFVKILSTAVEAGLRIQWLSHELLDLEFFLLERHPNSFRYDITPYISNLRSLALTINNVNAFRTPSSFDESELASSKLHDILCACPLLENLELRFVTTECILLNFLLPVPFTRLHTLVLDGVRINPEQFINFLEGHSETLRRLSLSDVSLDVSTDGFLAFFENFKIRVGHRLEKVQFYRRISMTNAPEYIGLLLWPIYKEDWTDTTSSDLRPRIVKTKRLEDFILRGEPWPLGEEHKERWSHQT